MNTLLAILLVAQVSLSSPGFVDTLVAPVAGSGPTVRTVTITPTGQGGTYTTLSAAEAAEDDTGDLVSRNERIVFEISGDWTGVTDTTAVTFLGWTTDATRYIEVKTVGDARHAGKWDTGAYRLDPGDANAIVINEEYVRIDGLQVSTTATANSRATFQVYTVATADVRVSNCIMRIVADSGTNPSVFYVWDADAVVTVWNTVIYGGFTYGVRAAGGTITAYNNTVHGGNTAYYRASGTLDIYNCIANGNTTDFFGTIGGNYNLTNEASGAPGAQSVHAATLDFVDAANGDFHLAAGDTEAIGATTDQSSGLFTTDIDGDTRGTTWDIGADER